MESSAFFDGVPNYGQEHFNRYFKNLFYSGISVDDSGNMELAVTVSQGKPAVGTGFAIIEGFSYNNDSLLEHDITPDANYERIDRMVIRLDLPQKKVYSALKKGTAGSSPQPPSLQRDNLIYELSLAQVRVSPSGTVTITDERFNQSVCGALRPRNMSEFNAMVKEFQKEFEDWFNTQQAKGWRNIFVQANTPEGAVSGNLWL